MEGLVKCGCGKHYIFPSSAEWDGKKWRQACLVEYLTKETAKHKELHADLRSKISKLSCESCDNNAGRNFKIYGNCIYCDSCMHEIGGES